MRPGSSELVDALQAGERVYDVQVRLGGRDVSDEVTAWSIDRGSDTSLPEQVATPTGSSAARAQITLAGDGQQTAAARYSPWAPRATADIARPGQSCVVEWGLAQGRMQALRGRVTRIDATSADGTAPLTALDGAERLRGRAWLPPATVSGTGDGARIQVQWVVDHLLRSAGIYTSPPPRDGSIFFASLNGSREANLGMRIDQSGSVGYYPARSPWTAGPAGSSTNPYAPWSATWAPQKRVLSQANQLLVEWWFYREHTGDNPTTQTQLVFADRPATGDSGTRVFTTITMSYNPATRQMRAEVDGGAMTWTLPATVNQAGRFKIAFLVGLTTTSAPVTVRGWLYQPNGNLYASTTYGDATPSWSLLETIRADATGPMECLNVSVVSGTVPVVQPWERGAQVDLIASGGASFGLSYYALRVLPEVTGSVWDTLKQIVADNLGYMWFDEDGLLRVRRYDYINPNFPPPAPDLTVTAAREIADITVGEEIGSVANEIEVGWSGYLQPSAQQSELYNYSSVITLNPGATVELRFDFPGRPWNLRPPMIFAGTAIPSGSSQGSLVKWITSTGARAPVEIELDWSTGWPVIRFTNRGSNPAYSALTTALNTPSLRLAHAEITQPRQQPVGRRNLDSIAKYGIQSLEIGASAWVQNAVWADQIGLALVAWTAWPVPLTGLVDILPDPRIQIGDVVHIIDRTGTRIDGIYRVLGYTVRGTGPQVRMTLDVRPLTRPAQPEDASLTMEPVLDPAVYPPLSG
ncbi:hypothetical protein ABZ249_25290 [Nocardiopsis sp. NPDC006139]|uniref:hypothetical protein n=1 Tax=Nocardiopsis sp. NPDC006139 TaxID=3154578 RepID=UPI0033A55C14